jgi:DNA-binding winged helix-turn-helix (wHTH) protein
VLDPALKEVTYGGDPVHFRPKEYSLLELFLRSPRQVFDREMILDRLWTINDSPTKFAVTNLIKDLRQRLQNAGMREELIETVYGLGYRLKPAPSLQSVQSRFQDSLPQRLKELEIYLAIKDYKLFQETAHKLAGTLGTFGYGQATEVARSMEHAEPDQYPRLIKALARALTVPTKSTYSRPSNDLVVLIGENNSSFADELFSALDELHLEMAVISPSQTIDWLKEHSRLAAIVLLLKSPLHLLLLAEIRKLLSTVPILVVDYVNDTLERRAEISGYQIDRYLANTCTTKQIIKETLSIVAPPPH